MAMGSLVKVFGWYDNEWGYSNRLVDLARDRRPRAGSATVQLPQLEDLPARRGKRVLVRVRLQRADGRRT